MPRSLYVIVFVLLTLVTQIGGLVLVISTLAVWAVVPNHRLGGFKIFAVHAITFSCAYAAATAFLMPELARWGGRQSLQCLANEAHPYAAYSPFICVFNRQYVTPEMATLMDSLSADLAEAHPGTVTAYLDAGFPLLDGFPMFPHLSHDDGMKLDLSYFYREPEGEYRPLRAPSPIGYWAFQAPPEGTADACSDDERAVTMRWDLEWLQASWSDYQMDEERTAAMLEWLTQRGPGFGVSEVLIEPHLAERLGVSSPVIGFAGCHAARHDDHLHITLDERG
jgi:hypothetical protein